MSIIPTQDLVLWHCIMTVGMTILGISLLTDIIQRQDSKNLKLGIQNSPQLLFYSIYLKQDALLPGRNVTSSSCDICVHLGWLQTFRAIGVRVITLRYKLNIFFVWFLSVYFILFYFLSDLINQIFMSICGFSLIHKI